MWVKFEDSPLKFFNLFSLNDLVKEIYFQNEKSGISYRLLHHYIRDVDSRTTIWETKWLFCVDGYSWTETITDTIVYPYKRWKDE